LIDGEGHALGKYREQGLPRAIIEYSEAHDLELVKFSSLEAQLAALADDIAYNAHDIDDALRAKLFDVIDLADVPLAGEALSEVLRRYPNLERSRLVHETVRRIIAAMVRDVLAQTEANCATSKIGSPNDVRDLGRPLAAFSTGMADSNRLLQSFLTRSMYRHERVLEVMDRAQRVIRDLFTAYMDEPAKLPAEWRDEAATSDGPIHARQVCDFLAGMTDRYALEQHKRLFDLEPLSR
jgi:dGTPase